jgi:hypothetical protein
MTREIEQEMRPTLAAGTLMCRGKCDHSFEIISFFDHNLGAPLSSSRGEMG